MPIKHWFIVAATALILVAPMNMVRAADPTSDSFPEDPEVVSAVPSEDSASDQDLYQPTTNLALNVSVPNLTQGFQYHAGLLYLQPSADNLGYAALTTEKNFASPVPLASPYWQIESLRPGFQPGFEVGADYAFARPGTDFQANWQHLRTSTSNAASAGNGQWISPFSQTGPPTADSYDELYNRTGVNLLRSATGQVNFAYDQANFDFGQYINICSSLTVRFFSGLSFARVQERLVSSFFGAPPAANAVFPDNVPLYLSLNNTSTFSGVGPRLGFENSYQTPSGLRFTSQLAGALLIGQTQPSQYLFTATAPGLASIGIPVNNEGIYSNRLTHVVYAANAKLGLGYSRVLSNGSVFTFDGGYLAAVLVNPFAGYETNSNILAIQIGSLSSGSIRQTLSNFSANGFYLNAGLQW